MANLITITENKKRISDRLYGIFLEDINYAVDGGLNANMVNNYSFDGVYMEKDLSPVSDPLRYWSWNGIEVVCSKENGMSNKTNYAKICVDGKGVLENLGYNGNKENKNRCAVNIDRNKEYEFSAYIKSDDFVGNIYVSVLSEKNESLTDEKEIEISSHWQRAELSLLGKKSGYGKLSIRFEGKGTVCLDLVSLLGDYLGKGDAKWSGGKFRRDLVEALRNLHPSFMRFPGGCIVEGTIPKNEYNWKDTVGKLEDRIPNYNLWSERTDDGGYSQSFQIGFYEYFCLCEEIGTEPLPILTAGLNCQIRSWQRKEKECPNVPIGTKEFEEYIVANYIDLIDFANGEKGTSYWADLRVEMGHEKPFGLKMIGIGNENYGKDYLERFRIIKEAVAKKDPTIECVHCSGLGILEHSVVKMRKHIAKNYDGVLVDEHKYRNPEWFFKSYGYFDKAKKQLGNNKIYFGEYAANVVLKKNATIKDYNKWRTALSESVFLLGIEKNGDVVEMCSYAPLFNLVTCLQWTHNLIDFNPRTYIENANYKIQKLFGTHTGNEYIGSVGKLPKNVYVSVTKKENEHYIKVVNASKKDAELTIETGLSIKEYELISIGGDGELRNDLDFDGVPKYLIEEKIEKKKFNKNISLFAESGKVYIITVKEDRDG